MNEVPLGTTILTKGKRTTVPEQVKERLELKFTPGKSTKLLWTREGDEIVVTKGTPQSSWMKTLLSGNGTAAVPKHVREALKMKWTSGEVERILWVNEGGRIVVRKQPRST